MPTSIPDPTATAVHVRVDPPSAAGIWLGAFLYYLTGSYPLSFCCSGLVMIPGVAMAHYMPETVCDVSVGVMVLCCAAWCGICPNINLGFHLGCLV